MIGSVFNGKGESDRTKESGDRREEKRVWVRNINNGIRGVVVIAIAVSEGQLFVINMRIGHHQYAHAVCERG